MAASELAIIITASDKASDVLRGIGKAGSSMGGILGGAVKLGGLAAAAGFTAFGAAMTASVVEAMQSENAITKLDAAFKASQSSAGALGGTSREAMTAIRSAASEHAAAIKDVQSQSAATMADLNMRAQDMALQHKERISDLNDNLQSLDEDFNDAKSDLQDRLNETTDAKDRARIEKQMARLDRHHTRSQERLRTQIDRENQQYERATQKLQEEKNKQTKIVEDQLKKIEEAYSKTMDALAEKFTAVERGIMLPQKVEQISRAAAIDLASALQKVTKFSDEQIISAEAILLRFRSIGKEIFPRATEASLDLAEALGIDATSAATMLGKALSSPGEGVARLKAAGVDFTKAQEDMIKKMTLSGDTAGAQRLILDELSKTTGGAATEAGKTFAGQIEILRNQFSDTLETIGGQFLPGLTNLTTFLNKEGIPALNTFTERAIKFSGEAIVSIKKAFETGDWKPVTDAILAALIPTRDQAFEKLSQLADRFTDWARDPATKEKFADAGNIVGQNLVWGLLDLLGMKETKDSIRDGLFNALKDAMLSVPELLAEFQAGLVTGIVQGIAQKITGKEATKELTDAFTAFFKAAIMDAWNAALAITNPFFMLTFLSTGGRTAIPGFQTRPGEFRQVPGGENSPMLGIVHGGEMIGRPGGNGIGGGGITINLYAPSATFTTQQEVIQVLQPLFDTLIQMSRARQVGATA